MTRKIESLVLLLFFGALLATWTSLITGHLEESDAVQNIVAAVNLAHEGVVSEGLAPPVVPSMAREPLPAFVGSLAVRAVDVWLGPAPIADYLSGARLKLLKLQNVFWLLVLSWCALKAARFAGLSFRASLAAVVVINLLLVNSELRIYLLDSVCTEAPAAALLMGASLLLAAGFGRRRLSLLAAAGFVYGLLALVKALFLYVAVGVAALVVLAMVLDRRGFARAVAGAAAFLLLFAVVVTPWMYRNHVQFGEFTLAGRGGEVLYTRGIMDREITNDEYLGGLYHWAPYPLNGALRRVLGFSNTDSSRGGRVQHLNEWWGADFAKEDQAAEEEGRPEDALTYFRMGSGETQRLLRVYAAEGAEAAAARADAELKQRGLALIKEHWVRHLAISPLFLWRGALLIFPPLALGFLWAAVRRRGEVALFLAPALGMVTLYSLISYFMPRYALPAAPVALLVVVVACIGLVRRRSVGL